MRFLRTAPTGRLLAILGGLIVAIAAGTAIAVAATSNGPIPRAKPLARAVHDALTAQPVAGITADITFTNGLISADNLPGETADPLLQGTRHGRVWLTNDHRLRIELQGDNGDANLVVNQNSFWVSDPMQHTVYEGTLPADTTAKTSAKAKASQDHVPTVADIQSEIARLVKHVDVAGVGTSNPGDVAGRAAYSVSVSPKHSGGLLGQAQLAWDAATGVPLRFAIYARDNPTPVLALTATNISYGKISPSDLSISQPAGDKVVKISTASTQGAQASTSKAARKARHAQVDGVAAVSRHVPFTLAAPQAVVGLRRQGVTLLDWGGKPAALLTYGQGLGGIAVIEQSAPPGAAASSGPGPGPGGLNLPSVSINGATGTELGTPLGTVVHFTRGGVSYTVLGSVAPYAAESAARALTPSP
ncbi:MAG: LolA family protein [Solirubrobacteraceae bacterium]